MAEAAAVYVPNGLRFYDAASRREMILVDEPSRDSHGWLCYRHPDGQFVTLREATDDDRAALRAAGATDV